MFDIGWSEMAVIAVVALIVIGPRDLPKLLYTAGKMAAKARATLHEFQQGLADMARETELDEVRQKIEKARSFNPVSELDRALDPTGDFRRSLDPTHVASPRMPAEPAAAVSPPATVGDGVTNDPAPPPVASPPAEAPPEAVERPAPTAQAADSSVRSRDAS
jgi:sec-independent protein translocase protein TatB